jgi:Right handed beta helix region
MRQLEKPRWQKKRDDKKRLWFGIIGFSLLIPLVVGCIVIFKNVSFGETVAVSGTTITVKAGGDFQTALNRAKPGDTILLEAGASFKGAFKLPNKTGSDFITIRTSASDAQLPPADTRLDPKKYAAVLPKIVPAVRGEPGISAVNGAHHYRFIGIEFAPTIEGFYNIIQLGSTEEKTIEELPHHIEFDRVYLHGDPKYGQRRGIAANGRFLKIKNSYFSDFKREGEESQAIAIWASDGHIEIVNNYLEAAAENILFGGAENNLKLVAADCLVKDNWMNKPLEWRNTKWVVKNFLEIKSGKRIKIENNLFTNNWVMAQEGTGILFRTAVDSGDQAVVEDIEFTDNIVRGSSSAVNIFGGEGKGGRNLLIRNNVFEDITSKKYEGRGFFIKSTTFDNVTIENNTVIQDGSIALAYGEPVTRFVFRNNIVFQNEYGFFGDGIGVGRVAIAKHFPQAVISNNIIIGGDVATYGRNNILPPTIAAVSFINQSKNDYRLPPNSPFLTKGYEGKQIGANLDPQTVGGK